MQKFAVVVVSLLVVLRPSLAHATDPYPETIKLGLDGSIPLQYGTNPLATHSNIQSDFFASPLLQLSIFGNLTKDLSYSFYVASNSDSYSQLNSGNDAMATIGTQITKKTGNWAYGIIYEHNLLYDGIFQRLGLIAEDFTGFGQYTLKIPSMELVIKPAFATSYRSADDPSANRFLFSAKADIEKVLTAEWSAVATGRLRYYLFTEGSNADRRELLATGSAGVKYALNADVSITTTVGFEQRISNIPEKNYSNLIISSSLDFSHVLATLK